MLNTTFLEFSYSKIGLNIKRHRQKQQQGEKTIYLLTSSKKILTAK